MGKHAPPRRSNGRYRASQEALAHGIPLLIAGEGETKVEVAVGHAWTDAALNFITETAEAGIRAALGTVTGDPAYRAHARRMQAIPAASALAQRPRCPSDLLTTPGSGQRGAPGRLL
jgi:UDP:flavonoid glycosyltransferase YjiC (YdhE family)